MTQDNSKVNRSKERKNDEFYTPFDFIKTELDCYKEYFKCKVVYLPCDNPRFSNFVKYFVDNKSALGLKKLLVSYIGEELKREVEGVDAAYNCSFESNTARDLAESSDIIITNPPFSRFGAFLDFCLSSKKKFLIIGSNLALSTKKAFKLYKDRAFDFGYNKHLPKQGVIFAKEDGTKIEIGAFWYTNLNIKRMFCFEQTKPLFEIVEAIKTKKYPCYSFGLDLFLKRAADYPKDYFGVVALPITSLWRIDRAKYHILELKTAMLTNGKKAFKRVLVKRIEEK